jgi:hypothetical protein
MCLSIGVTAQSTNPTGPQPQSQQPSQPGATAQQASTVLTGCVYREKDVPGRAPNIAERAGVLEDYILAEIRPAQAEPGTPGATGTSGTTETKAHSMYKLELVDDDRLKAVVGKRVEVTGRVDAEAGDTTNPTVTPPSTTQTDRVLGRDRIDLAEFEVTNIREVTGTCPATPSGR